MATDKHDKKPSEVFHSEKEKHSTIAFDHQGDAHDKSSGKYVSDTHVNRSLSHEKPANDAPAAPTTSAKEKDKK